LIDMNRQGTRPTIIIPAAGIGSRLRPHTHTIPKSLLHVAGKPILGHILDSIAGIDPAEIVIVTGFLGDKVQEYVSEHYRLRTRFVEQAELLGLGYAVHLALKAIGDGPVMILLGDTIVETDMAAFMQEGSNVLGLTPVEDPTRFGIAEVVDGMVIAMEEKPAQPRTNLALIGLYYISDTAPLRRHLNELVVKNITTKGEIELTDALQRMIDDGGRFRAFTVDGWYDCGKRETLIATNRHLLEKIAPNPVRDGSVIIPPSYVAPTAVVESSIIGPYVSISDKAVVAGSIIRNSIIGYRAEVRHALLSDSLIGHNAVVFGDFRALNVGDSSEIGYF
jgi:glucose-1-phosphate thymidylyltransferase